MLNTNPAKLSRALSIAGFHNRDVFYSRVRRLMSKGIVHDDVPHFLTERGYFRHYTDYPRRPGLPVHHKYEIRTKTSSDTSLAVFAVSETFPKLVSKVNVSRFPNGLGVVVTWKQIGQEIQ